MSIYFWRVLKMKANSESKKSSGYTGDDNEQNKQSYLGWFPNLVSGAPKKVIAVIVVFSLIMGFFATGMEMDTGEEEFEPDRPKQKYLSTIRENFGAEEEMVQIAFTAHEGNVFTTDVLRDMVRFEEAILEEDKINNTLAATAQAPTGINTLANNLLRANQILTYERLTIQQASEAFPTLENQTKMFQHMNNSLSRNAELFFEFHETDAERAGFEGANQTLISMSEIISNPEYWAVMDPEMGYGEDFGELMGTLESKNVSNEDLSEDIDYWLSEMNEKEPSPALEDALEEFLNFVEGTGMKLDYMLEEEGYIEEKARLREMALSFFGIADPLGQIEMDRTDGLEDPPSLELSLEEKKSRLEEMDDKDITSLVRNITEYDPMDLDKTVDESLTPVERGINHLAEMKSTLKEINSTYETKEMGWEAERLERGYLASVEQNKTLVEETEEMFESALRLGPMLNQMDEMITGTVDKDYSPNDVQAESAIAIAFMDPEVEREERLEAQRRIIEIGEEIPEHSEVRVSAGQVMTEQINESADRSMNRLLPIAFLLVVIILFFVFRSIVETVLSLGALAIAIVWTFGFGVIFGYRFNPMIISVPILLTGLVIDYGIHMVMRYREEKERRYTPKESTSIAITAVGGALILTTFTTAIGFLSNRISDLDAMKQFGTLAAVGIISSLILMITFLPAVVQLMDERKRDKKKKKKSANKLVEKSKEGGKNVINGILCKSADTSDRHPWAVVAVVILLTGFSAYGAANVDTTFDMEDFLPEDQPQSQNIMYIGERFDVETSYAYILIEEEEIDSSSFLYAINETTENIRDSEMVGGNGGNVRSPLQVLQRYGTAAPGSMEYNETIVNAFQTSDTTRDGIPNENISELYRMLFDFEESRNEIGNVLVQESDNEQYRYPTAVIRLTEDGERIARDIDNAAILEEELEEGVEPLRREGYTPKITSNSMLGQETTSELTDTQVQSLILTLILVASTLTIVFYFKDKTLSIGIITTIPVGLATLWILGTMYAADIPLNVMTVTVTALTIGMGVDYSIHISHRFMEERELCDDLYEAIHMTVKNTGGAIFGSAITTIAAFGVLSTSEILPLAQFGRITALALLYSFIVAVFVLPAFLMIWAKRTQSKRKQ